MRSPIQTITIVDSAGRYVEIPWPVKRVACLTSDSVMALVALGVKDSIVGITTYAVGAPWAPNVRDIGTCYKPNIEAIIAVKPDVVITYVENPKSEDLEEKVEKLGIKVVRLDFYKVESMFAEFKTLGLLVNRTKEAEELTSYWKNILDSIKERTEKLKPEQRIRVYWEGYTDYTAVGFGTGWDDILKLACGINVFAESPVPYPKVSPEAVIQENPDVILKAVGPKVFKPYGATDPKALEELRNDIMGRTGWSKIKAVKDGKVYLICSEHLHYVFGFIAETAYVAKLLYPDLFKDLEPEIYLRHWIENDLKVEWKGGIWVYPYP
ncbi:MAG: ABC transporter substrate-binding protein [Candidatus Bathyarchaeota archaeon]